eukprot:SM000268S09741  [mRNA]  locus=s268:10998:11567:+ [translate_table: standard]
MPQAARGEAQDSLKAARGRFRASSDEVQAKIREAEPLRAAQQKLQEAGRSVRSSGKDLPCTSERELDDRLAAMEYSMQHETLSLTEEKRLMRDMKALAASREAVRAHDAVRASVSDSAGERDAVQARLQVRRSPRSTPISAA